MVNIEQLVRGSCHFGKLGGHFNDSSMSTMIWHSGGSINRINCLRVFNEVVVARASGRESSIPRT